jgi:hypothetical protein
MSAPIITRDLIVAHTRALRLPGVARVFEGLARQRVLTSGKRASRRRCRLACAHSAVTARHAARGDDSQ